MSIFNQDIDTVQANKNSIDLNKREYLELLSLHGHAMHKAREYNSKMNRHIENLKSLGATDVLKALGLVESAAVIWRHKKRGTQYRIIHSGVLQTTVSSELDGVDVTVYQDIESNKIWVRPTSEFMDGRFEQLK